MWSDAMAADALAGADGWYSDEAAAVAKALERASARADGLTRRMVDEALEDVRALDARLRRAHALNADEALRSDLERLRADRAEADGYLRGYAEAARALGRGGAHGMR